MNWKIGDKGIGAISGYVYEITQIFDNFCMGKILKGDNVGSIIPVPFHNLMPLEPRKGKPHPLTNIFK